MAKILYGVAGEGFGHSSRSHLAGGHLLQAGHDVIFACSRKSLSYLGKYFPGRVYEILGLELVYNNGRLSPVGTAVRNVRNFPAGHKRNLKLYKEVVEPFGPDLVISDYEPFVAQWGRRNGVPVITADHQCTLTCLELDRIKGTGFSKLNADMVTRAYYAGINDHVIINFFRAPLKAARAVLSGPVLRNEVVARQASRAGHIVMYTTDASIREDIVRVFNRFDDKEFFVYGFDEDAVNGNCVFKKTSTEVFLDDLASSSGVIGTAGFSLISECLYFRKKMLLMPVWGQFEQVLNAHYVEKLGMGTWMKGFDGRQVEKFVSMSAEPIGEHEAILRPDNQKYFDILDGKIVQVLGR